MYLTLLGDGLVACLRLAKLSPFPGRTKSMGFTKFLSSGNMMKLLEATALGSSRSLPFPFRLSLRRSRIPLELRFLTAGLRTNAPLEESRLWCDDIGVPEIAVPGSAATERPFRKILPVSICNAAGPVDVLSNPGWGAGLSSLQSAGVGGTVSRVVPLPGGRLERKGRICATSDRGDSEVLSRLCDRAHAGGGPGGGGGRGIPGSQPL